MYGRRWLLGLALAGAVVLAGLGPFPASTIGGMVLPALPVLGQGLTSQVGPLIGAEIPISVLDNKKHLPAVVYNPLHNEYLVLWHNEWGGSHRDVYAQRVNADGALLSWFTVSAATESRAQPAVAYDPSRDRYLVVWIYDYYNNGTDWDVYGRFVAWNGASMGPEFMINQSGWSTWNPVVAYSPVQDEFLVAWGDTPAGVPSYVSWLRLSASDGGFASGVTSTPISTDSRVNPDVAYNSARNEYLLVYQAMTPGGDIFATRLSGAGSVLGSGEFPIAAWPDSEESPSVAANSTYDQYLVAWQSNIGGSGNFDIYAWNLAGDGTVDPGGPMVIADTTTPDIAPEVAASGQQYLVAYQTQYTNLKYGIDARHVLTNRSLLPAFVVSVAYEDRTAPALAAGSFQYLAAWEHERGTTAFVDVRGVMASHYYVFTGGVYNGSVGDYSRPLNGVTLYLVGDGDSDPYNGGNIETVATTTTSQNNYVFAWIPNKSFNCFHVWEADPSGSSSNGAAAGQYGVVTTSNIVTYCNVAPGTYDGTAFFDALSLNVYVPYMVR